VHWSEAAERDLEDIVDHIALDSAINAEAVLDRLYEQALSLGRFAERGRRIPELTRRQRAQRANWRELVVRPWRIMYAIEGDTVFIVGVVDSRRDVHAWLANHLRID
jgi:plasmid stabilization system protein ParE